MKHPEDDVNERLRNALKRKFDNTSDQPDPELEGIILGSIKRRNPYIVSAFLLALTLLFLVATQTDDTPLPVNKLTVELHRHQKPTSTLRPVKNLDDRDSKLANISGHREFLKAKSLPKKAGSVLLRKDSVTGKDHNRRKPPVVDSPEQELIFNQYSNGKHKSSKRILKEPSINQNLLPNPIGKPETDDAAKEHERITHRDESLDNTSPLFTETKSLLIAKESFDGKGTVEFSVKPGEPADTTSFLDRDSLKTAFDPSLVFPTINNGNNTRTELLRKRPFIRYIVKSDLEIRQNPRIKPKFSGFEDHKDKAWSILAGFIPMNTFQILSISPLQSKAYQNFRFPSNFSNKKTSYKFQIGIEKRSIQLLVSYAGVRQAYTYQVATDEYYLDNTNNQLEIKREGIHKENSSTFHLIGLGIRKNLVMKKGALRNYYLNTGLDFSKVVGSKQNIIWGTAGIGKEVLLTSHASLMIGPYVEYSFSQLLSPQTTFKVRPYQIGISVNFKYLMDMKSKR